MLVITTILANNVVLSQFLGICSFLGVSQKRETAAGMGGALTFVLTLSSLVCGVLYHLVLVPFGLEYLKTIVFIAIVAALVQFVEMFLKKYIPSLYEALGILEGGDPAGRLDFDFRSHMGREERYIVKCGSAV